MMNDRHCVSVREGVRDRDGQGGTGRDREGQGGYDEGFKKKKVL